MPVTEYKIISGTAHGIQGELTVLAMQGWKPILMSSAVAGGDRPIVNITIFSSTYQAPTALDRCAYNGRSGGWPILAGWFCKGGSFLFRLDAKQQQNYSRLWCSEGFVNKADDYADDSPLDEVSHSLSQSEFQPDVQVHVVVQHKCANRENANENA
jgi:hypothetical protein